MNTGVCIACNAQDIEMNDEDMCENCAAEMSGADEPEAMSEEEQDV